MEMKPADIVLVRGTGWTADAIERITDSPYSHTAGLVKPNELIEAQAFRRTGYQGLDAYKGCADVFTCDQLTDEQRTGIVGFVMKRVGDKYDYLLIPVEAEIHLLHIPIHYDEHGRNICSTLWSDAYRAVGVDPFPAIEFPAPGDWQASKIMRQTGSY